MTFREAYNAQSQAICDRADALAANRDADVSIFNERLRSARAEMERILDQSTSPLYLLIDGKAVTFSSRPLDPLGFPATRGFYSITAEPAL